jgi:hypothetical protein
MNVVCAPDGKAFWKDRTYMPDDYFFHGGISDWSLVSTYIPSDERESDTFPKIRATRVRHDWRSDPATEKQINYLASFGVVA